MDKNVIHIKVAGEDEPGAFYLILRKGGGMFGGGGSITYSMDRLLIVESSKGDPVFFRAIQMVDNQPVVVSEFPITAQFEVVRKTQTDRLTEVEAAERQQKLNKVLDEIMGEEQTVPEVGSGQSHQGYL
jgi:hypothetical protein